MAGIGDFATYARRVSRANRQVHTTPTDAQREAGNFRAGKLHVHGLDLRVEYPAGGIRTGTSPDGSKWKRVMTCPYGRIKRTVGLDGEAVDFFMGPHPESQLVFVVSQLDTDGNLDEHKCVLGTRNVKEAKKLYLSNYPQGWAEERMGEVRGYFIGDFKKWLKTDAPRKNHNKKAASIPHDDGEVCGTCNARRIEHHAGACHNCGAIQSMVESRLKRTEQGLPDAVRNKAADILPGGEGDDKPDDVFNKKDLTKGTRHETEHTTNPAIAKEIAKDHLTEHPRYYAGDERKKADCGPGLCPKCQERGDTEWKNEVLGRCRKCDHVWFAHEKRSAVGRLLNGPKLAT